MGAPPDPRAHDQAPLTEEVRGWAQQYGPALRRYFHKKVGATEADDLVQNVFLNIQARGAEAGAIENVEGYLFRTAANVLARRLGREAWKGDPLAEFMEPRDELSPERALIAKEQLERVVEALKVLPPRTRQAFILHRFEEMTYVSIARQMGITTISVGKLIKRALRKLGDAAEGQP
jgi:RNA polymerase sigma factor (sigma-70 family)